MGEYMAHVWYEGNLNKEKYKHEKWGITYYDRGTIELADDIYIRYGLQTHFIEEGEDYLSLIGRYVLPLVKEGDILSISEKVIAMCQRQTVSKKEIRLGFFTKFLSRFATRTKSGIGMDEPYKLQLVIQMKGLSRVLFASVMAGLGKLFKKRGIFYKLLGEDVAGIDGLYPHSAFEVYHDLAVLLPKEPEKVCEQIYKAYHISVMIVDANDISVHILGCSSDLRQRENELLELMEDNPAGQDDEKTPFILIRKVGEVTRQTIEA